MIYAIKIVNRNNEITSIEGYFTDKDQAEKYITDYNKKPDSRYARLFAEIEEIFELDSR